MLQEVWLVTKIARLSKKNNVLVPSCIKIVEITQRSRRFLYKRVCTYEHIVIEATDFRPSWPRIIYTQLFEARDTS